MSEFKKTIYGFEIDESLDFEESLFDLEIKLREKLDFWKQFEIGKVKIEEETGNRFGSIPIILYFLTLLPSYIQYILSQSQRNRILLEAKDELQAYYDLPSTKIRGVRLKCKKEKSRYREELQKIKAEIAIQKQNYNSTAIGEATRKDIADLIVRFDEKQKKKQDRLHFYDSCEKELLKIEERIKILNSINQSKDTLEELSEGRIQEDKQVTEEFELFKYYGNILEELAQNLKKVESDKEEILEELELKEMIKQVK